MSESRHTPGPWRVLRQNDIPTAVMAPHPDLGGYGVCLIVVGQEMEANSRLIASAPELLEALRGFNLKPEAIVSAQGETITLRLPIKAIQDAAAAVAKAEGTTP